MWWCFATVHSGDLRKSDVSCARCKIGWRARRSANRCKLFVSHRASPEKVGESLLPPTLDEFWSEPVTFDVF